MAEPRHEQTPRGAAESRHGLRAKLKAYLRDHARVCVTSLGRLYRHGGTSAMTAAVIGIALSLPAAMQVLVQNAGQISGSWEGAARISLYLKSTASDADARALALQLSHMDGVAAVESISPDQALAEF